MNIVRRYWKWCETADREIYAAVCLLQGMIVGAGIMGTIWMWAT